MNDNLVGPIPDVSADLRYLTDDPGADSTDLKRLWQ